MQLHTKILLGMLLGIVLGFLVGPNSALLPQTGVVLTGNVPVTTEPTPKSSPAPLSHGLKKAEIIARTPANDGAADWLEVRWELDTRQLLALQQHDPEAARGVKIGEPHTGFIREIAPKVTTFAPIGQTLVDATEWLGRLFLALIRMVVIPLVFFSLCVGVASLGDLNRLGRMGTRTVGLFLGSTVVALVIGMGLCNLIEPGNFLAADERARLLTSYSDAAQSTASRAADSHGFIDQLIAMVPSNPIASLASGDMLQIICFALLFGIALTMLDPKRAKPLINILDTANDAMVMLVHIAMKLAPIGVAALLFKVIGSTGISVLLALGAYTLVVLGGLFLHLTLTYGALVVFGAKLPFLDFLAAMRPALLLAFSTSSSSATLPITKQCVEENLGVSNETSSFVLPLGATINMDGTALYQGVAALFIAQIYGLDLNLGEQLTVVTSATLASVGAAGVPGAGMITLAMVLTAVGVPTEGLALVLGVDRLLDMFRTATNVVGDSTATVLMARLEGESIDVRSR